LRAHDGDVALDETPEHNGTVFVVHFPPAFPLAE